MGSELIVVEKETEMADNPNPKADKKSDGWGDTAKYYGRWLLILVAIAIAVGLGVHFGSFPPAKTPEVASKEAPKATEPAATADDPRLKKLEEGLAKQGKVLDQVVDYLKGNGASNQQSQQQGNRSGQSDTAKAPARKAFRVGNGMVMEERVYRPEDETIAAAKESGIEWVQGTPKNGRCFNVTVNGVRKLRCPNHWVGGQHGQTDNPQRPVPRPGEY